MKCAMSVEVESALELQSCSSTEPQNPFSSWPVVSDFDAQPSKNKGAMRAIKPLTEAL